MGGDITFARDSGFLDAGAGIAAHKPAPFGYSVIIGGGIAQPGGGEGIAYGRQNLQMVLGIWLALENNGKGIAAAADIGGIDNIPGGRGLGGIGGDYVNFVVYGDIVVADEGELRPKGGVSANAPAPNRQPIGICGGIAQTGRR